MPSDGRAPPLPGPHQRAGREETEANGPPATLEGEDDGGTSLSDPTLEAGPAPKPPGPNRGPWRTAESADPRTGLLTLPAHPHTIPIPPNLVHQIPISPIPSPPIAPLPVPVPVPRWSAHYAPQPCPLPCPAGGPGQAAEAPGVAPSPPGPDQGPGRAQRPPTPVLQCGCLCLCPMVSPIGTAALPRLSPQGA